MNATDSMRRGRFSEGVSALALVLVGVIVGAWALGGGGGTGGNGMGGASAAAATAHAGDADGPDEDAAGATIWTCSMHPQIRLQEKGLCPICNMDLISVRAGEAGGPAKVELSESARALAEIETVAVRREPVTMPLRLVGKVALDETRVARITAWFGGRIERAYVDFTGTRVRKGDHLVALYSPDLVVAQQELIAAAREAKGAPAGPLGEAARATAAATREKLRLWGLQDWQIRQIERRGRPQEQTTIYAPMGGVVVHKAALEGAWVQTGTPLYTIADLGRVWIELDAYESDLGWLRYQQPVRFEVAAFPGEPFEGRVSFVAPTMDPRTRTVKVRLEVDNRDLRLKPEMFVRAEVQVRLGGGAHDADHDHAALAGKWLCPMHPAEIADKAGRCGVCGMALVPAEKHWLVGPTLGAEAGPAPLVVPASAPLYTGRRTLVFVEQQGATRPTYLQREVRLGARAGEWVIVREGLMEGERVVSRGAFRLDASMQIAGQDALMSEPDAKDANAKAAEHADHAGHADHAEAAPKLPEALTAPTFAPRLRTLLEPALALAAALADDDAKAAAAAGADVAAAAKALRSSDARVRAIAEAADAVAAAAAIEAQRAAFLRLSEQLRPLAEHHAETIGLPFEHAFCPMANDGKGAAWLQAPGEIANPYYGASMLRCGEKRGGAGGGR